VHHNACDTRNQTLKVETLSHIMTLDQAFFDKHNESDIRSRLRYDCINNQITWNIPYIV